MKNLNELLEISAQNHSHLCPRQVLGVRMGLFGLHSLDFDEPPAKKRLLVITETDGCFADGISAATSCTIGHRTLRVEDYGKTASVFIDTVTGKALRIAPALDIREQAYRFTPEEPRHYFAQLKSYQIMPDKVMFTLQHVIMNTPVADIVSRPGVRALCDICGEEIINEREVKYNDQTLCRACANGAYYHSYVTVEGKLLRQEEYAMEVIPGRE